MLLEKLFYEKNSNLSITLQEYRKLKSIHKGPMLRQALKKMMIKFKETGELGMLQGRGLN